MHIGNQKNFDTDTEAQRTNEAEEVKQQTTGEVPRDTRAKNRANTAVYNDQLTDSF